MLLKDNKKGLITLIMKRMKGHDNDMSPKREEMREQKMEDGAYQDNEMAKDSCCEGMMQAIEQKDAKAFKRHLTDFFEMMESNEESKDY